MFYRQNPLQQLRRQIKLKFRPYYNKLQMLPVQHSTQVWRDLPFYDPGFQHFFKLNFSAKEVANAAQAAYAAQASAASNADAGNYNELSICLDQSNVFLYIS